MKASKDRVVKLARRLPMIWANINACATGAAKHSKHTPEHIRWANAAKTAEAQRVATEDLICALPATSLAGAAVHIMLARQYFDIVRSYIPIDDERVEEDVDRTFRALCSALAVVAREAGLDLREVEIGRAHV